MSAEKPKSSGKPISSGKKLACLSIGVSLIALAAVIAWSLLGPSLATSGDTGETTAAGQIAALDAGLSASGTTVLGTVEQGVGDALADAQLVVAEVYVAAGDAVKAGDNLLSVTADSLAENRSDLETAVETAKIALMQTQYQTDLSTIAAQEALAAAQALATTAKQAYNETVRELAANVETAKTANTDAKAIISDHPAEITATETAITDATNVKTQAEQSLTGLKADVTACQAAYNQVEQPWRAAQEKEKNAKAVYDYLQAYAVKNSAALEHDANFIELLGAAEKDWQDASAAAAVIEPEYRSAEAALAAAENAAKAGEATVEKADQDLATLQQTLSQLERELEQAQSKTATLQIQYENAVIEQQSKTLAAEQTYQENMLTVANADTAYELTVQKLEQSLAQANQTLTTAEDELTAFETAVGDGVLHAAYDGTLASVGYEADDLLAADEPLAVFYDSALLTVDVSIDQADIAEIAVGDAVAVSITSVGWQVYTGTVASIEMTSGSISISDVNYTVSVKIEGDLSQLSGGLTAAVNFTTGLS